jgi:hypothetical protein
MKINEYYKTDDKLRKFFSLSRAIYQTAHDPFQQEIDIPTETSKYERPILNRTVQGIFCDIFNISGLNTGLISLDAFNGRCGKKVMDHPSSRKMSAITVIEECLEHTDFKDFTRWFYDVAPKMSATICVTSRENSALATIIKSGKYGTLEIANMLHYKEVGIPLIEISTKSTYSSLITDPMRELIKEESHHDFF